MTIELTPDEARVLGVLIEKAATTPDQYPLSLNAVMVGCNQKSNRDPVTNFDQTQTVTALDGLISKHMVRERSDSGSRVAKYSHRLSGSLGLTFDFADDELAVLCVLMLRGPQTLGEIRVRTGRLWSFTSLDEVERTLDRLVEHKDGPYVRRLAREPGRKEARIAHLLCGADALPVAASFAVTDDALTADDAVQLKPPGADNGYAARIEQLEREVAELKQDMAELKRELGID